MADVSGYASWSVVFGEQPSAAKWNILGTNDAAFNTALTGSGTINSTILNNPYKFSVYRNAALSVNSGITTVAFDTKTFDTGSNVDITTNKGRFTAPIAGYYLFSAAVSTSPYGNSSNYIALFKNGSEILRGSEILTGTSGGVWSLPVSGLISLAASDYIDVRFSENGGGGQTVNVGAYITYFHGFLVSPT